jgi:hypothetical protein
LRTTSDINAWEYFFFDNGWLISLELDFSFINCVVIMKKKY